MTRRLLSILILTVLIMEAVVIGLIIGVTAGWGAGLGVGALMVAIPIIFMNILAQVLPRVGILGRLCTAHPLHENAFEKASGSTKLYSISLGHKAMAISGCVHLATDDDHLHLLIEIPLARASSGASIPWEAFEEVRRDGSLGALRLFDGGKLWIPWKFAEAEAGLRAGMVEVGENTGGTPAPPRME